MMGILKSAVAAALIIGGLHAAPALAQGAEKPSARDCSTAYGLLKNEQRRLYRSISDKEGRESIGAWVTGFKEVDLDRRIDGLKKVDPLIIGVGTPETLDRMNHEAMFADSDATFRPASVFQFQRQMFDLARKCDQAYGFKPEIPEPAAQEEIVKVYISRRDRDIARKNEEFAKMDDVQCAVRFWIMAQAGHQNPEVQQLRMEKLAFAGGKALEANPGMTEERLMVQLEREGTARVEKITNKSLPMASLYDDLNLCERRYQMPLTGRPAGS